MATRRSPAERARRLLALLPLLQSRRSLPVSELARLTGTDTATLAADLAVLSLCGADASDPNSLVPVLVENGEAVVFGEMPALGEPVWLTAAEAAALVSALETCGVAPDEPLPRRLAGVASGTLDLDEVRRTVRAATSPGGIAHTYALLTAAAGGARVTRLTYVRSGSAQAEERIVQPWDLLFSRGHWYLRAWDETRRSERTFRLDRIGSVEVTGTVFQRTERPAAPWGAAPDLASLPRATVVFESDTPDLSDREWPGAVFERLEDGRIRARVPYAGTAWIARAVTARLGDAVLTEPAEVRAAVAALAREALAAL